MQEVLPLAKLASPVRTLSAQAPVRTLSAQVGMRRMRRWYGALGQWLVQGSPLRLSLRECR